MAEVEKQGGIGSDVKKIIFVIGLKTMEGLRAGRQKLTVLPRHSAGA
jgi:hypothetical protein